MNRQYSGKKFLQCRDLIKDQEYPVSTNEIWMTEAPFIHGTIGIISFEALANEAAKALVSFARVFELIYTRFLDLQKAEAQSREALIEAA